MALLGGLTKTFRDNWNMVTATGANKPNFKNGLQVNGSDFTTATLATALGRKISSVKAAAGAAFLPAASTEAIITGGTKAIAAGALSAGDRIEFVAAVKVVAVNATDTITVRVRIGAVTASLTGTVCASQLVGATSAANDVIVLRGSVICGSFATPNMTMIGLGTGNMLIAGIAGHGTATIAPAFTLNSVNAIDLSVTVQFSTNSGTNSAQLHAFNHDIIAGTAA
jgi:hypothetical protein